MLTLQIAGLRTYDGKKVIVKSWNISRVKLIRVLIIECRATVD